MKLFRENFTFWSKCEKNVKLFRENFTFWPKCEIISRKFHIWIKMWKKCEIISRKFHIFENKWKNLKSTVKYAKDLFIFRFILLRINMSHQTSWDTLICKIILIRIISESWVACAVKMTFQGAVKNPLILPLEWSQTQLAL